MTEPLKDYAITEHAAFELQRRGIARETVQKVLSSPEQRHGVRPGRDVFQTRDFAG